MTRPTHAVLYCRSAQGSARSLEEQEERCKRKAFEEGAETTATIIDPGPAHGGMDRPSVLELRRLVRAGKIDLVVVDTPDRLTKRIGDIRALAQEVSRAGARLVFLSP